MDLQERAEARESFSAPLPAWLQEGDVDALVKEVQKGVPYFTLFKEQKNLPVQYWAFWKALSGLAAKGKEPTITMRLQHKPVQKTFVDYTDRIDIYCPETGDVHSTQLFVGTLPFSSLVYAEFTFDQKPPRFVVSHERMWTFFGGVTPYTVADNLKASVVRLV